MVHKKQGKCYYFSPQGAALPSAVKIEPTEFHEAREESIYFSFYTETMDTWKLL